VGGEGKVMEWNGMGKMWMEELRRRKENRVESCPPIYELPLRIYVCRSNADLRSATTSIDRKGF